VAKNIQNRRLRAEDLIPRTGKFIDVFDGKRAISRFGAGDSSYTPALIRSRDQDAFFERLLEEVAFVQMFNMLDEQRVDPLPRLVAAQTDRSEPTAPIYRMPACNESNIQTRQWTPAVSEVRDAVSAAIKQPLNHVVGLLYFDEQDSLAFHHDKVLDLDEESLIVNVSFGAARPIVFREREGRRSQTIVLQPGSMLVLGPQTNRRFVHSVPKLFAPTGPRLSLSLRHTRSFVDQSADTIHGKGEAHQTLNYPFIQSHDDPSRYSDELRRQIAAHTARAQERLRALRATV